MEPLARRDHTGQEFVIRTYTPADRPELEAFYHEFEPKRAAQGLPPQGPEAIARWLDAILTDGIHLLALCEQELVGHAFLAPMQRPREAEYAVFLSEDVRGRGMGTQLNSAAVDAARAAGLRRLWLSVEPRNRAAIRSYQKVGFRFIPGTIYSPEAEMELELRPAGEF